MTEALFVLTLVFVAYVVYIMVTDTSSASDLPIGASVEEKAAAEVAEDAPATQAQAQRAEKAAAPKVERKAEHKPAVAEAEPKAAAAEAAPKGLRNPKTGDVASIPTNYRFAKRWIKEAMVSEGLLDRIYKNNELDDKNSEKVRSALESFKALEKYHA